MDDAALALRRQIMLAFARTGAPPALAESPELRALAAQRVVVLAPDGQVLMAHPFAASQGATRVDAAGGTWWGNCAWDGLGIVAALDLSDATVTSNRVTVRVRAGAVEPADVVLHVAVPAARWWEDIAFT